jgi:hypothetical protein
MKGSDFLVDVLKDNPLWESFADIAKETYDSKLGVPLKELERLRHISQNTDTVHVERALRQAGLNLSNEFFNLNREKLTRTYHELIKFWELNGTPNYTKFIEFLLGRTFIEDTLFTTDYLDFSPVSGKLNTDGGSWYSTSHVDLSVEAEGLRESLNLRITQDDIPSIRKALGYLSATDEEKDSINQGIKLLQLREINIVTDDPRIIKTLTENRILETYYQFAPIEKVVRDIYLTIRVIGNLRIFASSMVPARRYFDSSTNVVIGYDFRIPQKIQGYKEYVANVLINWSETTRQDPEHYPLSIGQDTLQSELYPSSVKDKGQGYIQSFDGRTIIFNDVDTITTIILEIEAQGIKWETTRELYPIGIPFAPDELTISGSDFPAENAINIYKLIAKTDNIREPAEEERVSWSTSSDIASFVDNRLVVQEIFEDSSALVYAHYRNLDSTITTLTKSVNILQEQKPRTAKGIRIDIFVQDTNTDTYTQIDPGTELEQGTKSYYAQAVVAYNDNTEMNLYSQVTESQGDDNAPLGIWESSTRQVTLEENLKITAPILFRDYAAILAVSYVDNGRKVRATQDLFFKKPRVFINSIEIIGAGTVIEETRNVFQLQATWNTGAITLVDAVWGSSSASGATSARVSPNGILFAPTVDADSENVNITASISVYRYNEQDEESIVTLSTSKIVTVKPLQRAIQRIDIQTLNGIRQGNTNIIRFYAQWNDNTSTEVIPHLIEVVRDGEVISSFIRTSGTSGSFDHAVSNPVILGLSSDTFYAKEDDVDHQRFQLDYLLPEINSTLESFNGLVDINIYYIDPVSYTNQVLDQEGLVLAQEDEDIILTESNIKISAVPKIFLSESLTIVYPDSMREGQRTFLTALVTYANGDQEESQATWEVSSMFEELETETDLTQGRFTVDSMVNSLLSLDRRWFDANTLSQTQIDNLVRGEYLFQTLSLSAPADWTRSVRDLMDQNTVAEQVQQELGLDITWFGSNTLDDNQADTLKFEVDRYIAAYQDNPTITNEELTQLVFNDLTLYPGEIVYHRALLQTRPLVDGTSQQFKVTGRFFQQEETVLITNVSDPIATITEIFNSRIEGPGEILADTRIFFSYGLVTDFDDIGISYMSSNDWRVEVLNKRIVLALLENTDPTYRSLLPTRNDLSIVEVEELTDEQLEEIFTQVIIAEIDTNGYLYPRINVPAQLRVHADYEDGITVFTRSMDIFMKETATILTSMGVYNISNTGDFQRTTNVTVSDSSGSNSVIQLTDIPVLPDVPDGFQRIDPVTGALVYTFQAELTRTDDRGDELGLFAPQVVEWSLDTASDRIYLGTPTRDVVTVIVNEVETDTQVIINASYREEFSRAISNDGSSLLADEDRVETRNESLRFIIESSKAIETILLTGSTVVFDNTDRFYPSAGVQRRDGSSVIDPDAFIEWYILAGPINLVQNEDGSFLIPTLRNNTTMTLRAVAIEGSRSIQEDFVFNLQLSFQPQSIELVLPQSNQVGLLDSSISSLSSSVIDLDGLPNDVTQRTFFYFNYNEKDASLVDNILTLNAVAEDKVIEVTLRSQDYLTLDPVAIDITVYSTFPLVGTAPFGVTTDSLFVQESATWNKVFTKVGGTFEVDPGPEEYGYFSHPKKLGIARFNYIPEINSAASNIGGWNGASRDSEGTGTGTGPIQVTRTYDTDLTEEWYVYRTNLRGFSRGKFAVSYYEE